MILKHIGTELTVKKDEMKNKTINGLKDIIRENFPLCKNLSNKHIVLYHNKSKIEADDETSLDDNSLGITEDSKIYVIAITHGKKETENNQESNKTQAKNNLYNNQNKSTMDSVGSMPNILNTMGGGANMNDFFNKMMSNPEMLNAMYESMANIVPPDQRQAMSYTIELFKKNPELMRNMMEAFANQNGANPFTANLSGMFGNMGGMNRNMGGMSPNMGGMPPNMGGMSPNMGGMSPNMGNMPPNMGGMSPNMGNMPPNMFNMGGISPTSSMSNIGGMGMPNNGYYPNLNYNDPYNPYMYGYQPNGPYYNNFYPVKDSADANKSQQDYETLYKSQLASLNEMGFLDKNANVKALTQARGDLSVAIDILTRKMQMN